MPVTKKKNERGSKTTRTTQMGTPRLSSPPFYGFMFGVIFFFFDDRAAPPNSDVEQNGLLLAILRAEIAYLRAPREQYMKSSAEMGRKSASLVGKR